MNLQLVPHTHIDTVWPTVAPLLAQACTSKAACGEITIEQMRMAIVEKVKHLVVALEGEVIVGAGTIEFLQYPQKRVALISALGGRGLCDQAAFDTVKEWCKSMGASELRVYAKDAQFRLFARVGLVKLYNTLGVEL